jgi:hypothetical protein
LKSLGLDSERKPQVRFRQTAGRDRMVRPVAYFDGTRRLYEQRRIREWVEGKLNNLSFQLSVPFLQTP